MPPVVAVSIDQRTLGPAPSAPPHRMRPARPEVYLKRAVIRALRGVGLEPVLLPPHDGDPAPLVEWALGSCAGVVVTGGAFDIHPSHYGSPVTARLDRVDADRTSLELALCRATLTRGVPVLGLCGGLQALAVAAGGTLVQDIPTADPGALQHEQDADPAGPSHSVHLSAGHLLWTNGTPVLHVNSTHHQALLDPGSLEITGRAPDGVAEVAEHREHPFALGVQWHPELLGDTPAGAGVFRAFAAALRD
ncbi:MAG: gamma-glutamyl-gamma-aminobutyrate hydrolase family protein [Myxococcota bacterium]|nr:gamma-glutamyl-gamma-aminobutyrate hydrolase family protein [Myxococcota bacterium]MEC8425392.1 gamma-glutamyl-gamma-aminobutyrate hydrolase family protein [Myxococcota bacterium]